jgi:hypothetical protein
MSDKKKEHNPIVNTTDQPAELHLLDAMGDLRQGRRTGQHIEDMEARGQRQLVSQSSRLPTKGLTWPMWGDSECEASILQATWSQLGVKIGTPVEGDPTFTNVELPLGWRLEATDHSMWSELLDDKGRVRASMFYKAAFYDRSAFIRLNNRFFVGLQHREENPEDRHRRALVIDQATDVGGNDPALYGYGDKFGTVRRVTEWTEDLNGGSAECEAWLDEQYPQWREPTAYWDK